ncbi:hypothetical protein CJF42_14290 [Pseudoalteromonas sp. NBT06-2]|nr:hypothetical protein CJF42_14290 [Pseudoalteromonas sp. NBT06-2]
MYSQFFINNNYQFDRTQINFQKCIIGGNWLMLISLCITLLCLTMTFGFDHLVNMYIQVAGHIFTIVFAGIFKVGYVIRCIGVHGLGYKVF